jgi:hypothetical protein
MGFGKFKLLKGGLAMLKAHSYTRYGYIYPNLPSAITFPANLIKQRRLF